MLGEQLYNWKTSSTSWSNYPGTSGISSEMEFLREDTGMQPVGSAWCSSLWAGDGGGVALGNVLWLRG